jgi:hypothetical protein
MQPLLRNAHEVARPRSPRIHLATSQRSRRADDSEPLPGERIGSDPTGRPFPGIDTVERVLSQRQGHVRGQAPQFQWIVRMSIRPRCDRSFGRPGWLDTLRASLALDALPMPCTEQWRLTDRRRRARNEQRRRPEARRKRNAYRADLRGRRSVARAGERDYRMAAE